jgi:hypothetical protein
VSIVESGLGTAEKLLGSRFVASKLLPLALATAASLPVALAAFTSDPGRALQAWQQNGVAQQLLTVLWILLGLAGAAYLFTFCQLPALRALEGYWPQRGPLGALHRYRTGRHRRRAAAGWDRVRELSAGPEQLRGAILAAKLLTAYPPPSRLATGCLPTAFGNRLRAAEYYPLERYGIDAVVIWPRLRPVLPPEAGDRLSAARATLDGSVNLLLLSAVYGTIWPLVLLIKGGHALLACLALLAWPVAWAVHRATLRAAVSYGQELRVAFDLHRYALLRQLELNIPKDPAGERRLWDSLTQFYLRNLPFDPAQAEGTG